MNTDTAVGRRSMDVRYVFMAIIGLFFLVVIVYPLSLVVVKSFSSEAGFTFENYVKIFSESANLKAFWNSIWVSSLSTLICVAVGTILAMLVVRTDIPGKSWLRMLLLLPYGIPPFIGAMAWAQLFGPVGYVSKLYMTLTGATSAPWNIYSAAGVVLVLAVYQFPVVFITVSGALGKIDTSLEEAARMSGAGPFRTLIDVTMPLITPAITASALLAFVGCISNFGIPALLGFRARFFVLTTKIYSALSIPDMPLATAMAVILAITSGIPLILERRLERGQSRYTVIAGKSVRPQTMSLGGWRIPVFIIVVLVSLFAGVVPLISMLLTSFLKYWGAPLNLANMTTSHYKYILDLPMASRAFRNSLFLAVSAATITMAVGALVSYMSVRAKIKGAKTLDFVGTIPYAVPCTMVAIAMILAWSRPPVMLYGTIWVILAAYLVRYMPFSIRTTNATLQQVHVSLEEAARVSGAGWTQTMRDIVMPLIKPGLIAGWILVFMPALRELTMSVLLWSQGAETIGVVIYNMQDAGYTQIAAALSTIVLLVILAGNAIVRKLSKGEISM
ncbi:MAG TPA: iron ABC transporter permease [Bacillota bacterium]|nr:iron ABC transporter permease [Bacillota bacterium]HOK70678.1 iron ABC transporter permease [Bacillota bacterium]HOL50854.1 iron ABC transporter permease [Bacillota bacterium]HOO31311.1 iron ABC transporter permease [Bacillota bacterium]HPQ03066.1 iron ABC transporter permease [Bacillota bacterium]